MRPHTRTAARAHGHMAVVLLFAVTAIICRDPAWANESGRIGYSGKQGAICNACHVGGTRPAVHFEGPAMVASGATATFRFVLDSRAPTVQDLAGLNIAVSDGILHTVTGQKTRLSSTELTHTEPKAIDASDQATWEFTWTAPTATGPQKLFGAGNSVNGNGNTIGDRAAAATFDVEVIAAVATATPTASATATTETHDTPTATATETSLPPPTATSTLTAMPMITATTTQTPTATSTPPPTATVTFSPMLTPTATRTPAEQCIGDCDADQRVTVDELVTGVNIALTQAALTACPSFDRDGDARVSVAELVAAVRRALQGC